MRIAYITHTFPPAQSAAAIIDYTIVQGLVNRGHELLVFCPQTFSKYTPQLMLQDKNQHYPFDVYYSFPTPLSLSLIVPHLFNALKALKHRYDLVITQLHLFHFASYTGLLSKTLGKAWVVKVHDMIPDPTLPIPISEKTFINSCYGLFVRASYGLFLRNVGKKADRLLVLTNELKRLLLENNYPLHKVAVIPHGVDTKLFSPPNSKSGSIHEKTILYVGSMWPEDGLSSLVKAFALLDQEKGLNLTLIGDGPERSQLLELVKKLDLEHRVNFYRHVPHKLIPEFIRKAYVCVGPLCLSPINYYTIPTKILEYFACGKPVVSSPVSKDVLVNEFTGLVVKNVTPKVIAKQFSRILDDEKLASQMGTNARRLAIEKFNWEKIISQIEREIQEIESHRYA